MASNFTLGKNERLKSRKLIGQLFSEGKSIAVYPLRLLYSVNPAPDSPQAGFTVSSKNFKRAVDRNRIKRLMREAYRLNKNELKKDGAALTLFFIYTGKDIIDFESMCTKIQELFKKLAIQVK
ncbi:MAG: ribonuclease P protein component [Chitinophagaceae bacterium]|nr:ribonuclease P protein component [Chitinophagaceae bacterium]